MEPKTVALVFALLLGAGALAVLVALVRPDGRAVLVRHGFRLVTALAVSSTLASLYFSEIADYAPCQLCWYQRIAMYPIAVIMVAALIRRDRSVLPYVQILALAGLAFALYHVQLQAFPDQESFCRVSSPCTKSPVKAAGIITIPQMSAAAFAGVALVTTVLRRSDAHT